MSRYALPVLSALVGLVLLVLYHLHLISAEALLGVAVALPLPGLPDLVRALRPAQLKLPSDSELGLVGQLSALTLRWADQPRARAQAVELQEILERHMDRAEAALPTELRPPTRSSPTPPSLPPAALLLLLPFLALQGCAAWPSYAAALRTCGLQVAPAGVQAGVSLALHGGDGWAGALADLITTYGECVVRAEVTRAAGGDVQDPPRRADVAPVATLIGGELSAGAGGVSAAQRAEAQRRAQAWLRWRR